jgi:23S rRNA-/tRNA-specific pseudouridylate synthase
MLQAFPESFILKRNSLIAPLFPVMTTDPFLIPILSAGRGWLIVEKPTGLNVQGEQGQDLCFSLQTRINTDPDLRKKIDCDPGFGVLPVHRLDRETSGVILLACQPRTFSYFAMQFEHHKVRKRYIALLHGDLPEPATGDGWGLWSWPLSKEAGGRLHPEGRPGAVPSETRFRVLRKTAHYTLIECDLLTGRKHQIRRHARLAGHAVVGDARYGTPRSLKFLREKMDFHRVALHSFSLQVQLPGAPAPQVFQSPGIPPEILRLLEEDQSSEEG